MPMQYKKRSCTMTNVQIIKSGNDLQLQTEQLLGTCLQLLSKSKAEILSNYWESHRIKYYLKKNWVWIDWNS